MAAFWLPVVWGIVCSGVLCHGTEEGELILVLTNKPVPGRLQSVGGTSLPGHWGPAGQSSQKTHSNDSETGGADWWRKNINENHLTWLNQESRNTQLYKYLKSTNLLEGGQSFIVGFWNEENKPRLELSKRKCKLIIWSKKNKVSDGALLFLEVSFLRLL